METLKNAIFEKWVDSTIFAVKCDEGSTVSNQHTSSVGNERFTNLTVYFHNSFRVYSGLEKL